MSDETELEARLIAARAAGPLDTLPETAVARARQLFRLYAPQPTQQSGRVLLARLVLDSFRGPQALAAARGATTNEARELLFDVGDLTFRLFQEPFTQDDWFLIGQLLTSEELPVEGIRATLEPGELAAVERGKGELHFESVPPGRYTVRLLLPDGMSIVVPEVPVGQV
jgi:hypothetical protein